MGAKNATMQSAQILLNENLKMGDSCSIMIYTTELSTVMGTISNIYIHIYTILYVCRHMAWHRLATIHESCPQMRLQLTRTPSTHSSYVMDR